jgi:hypothetical protein
MLFQALIHAELALAMSMESGNSLHSVLKLRSLEYIKPGSWNPHNILHEYARRPSKPIRSGASMLPIRHLSCE